MRKGLSKELEVLTKGYWPQDTNILAKIYQACKHTNVLMLQTHLWDYSEPGDRETRSQEIILAALEVLDEFDF